MAKGFIFIKHYSIILYYLQDLSSLKLCGRFVFRSNWRGDGRIVPLKSPGPQGEQCPWQGLKQFILRMRDICQHLRNGELVFQLGSLGGAKYEENGSTENLAQNAEMSQKVPCSTWS